MDETSMAETEEQIDTQQFTEFSILCIFGKVKTKQTLKEKKKPVGRDFSSKELRDLRNTYVGQQG